MNALVLTDVGDFSHMDGWGIGMMGIAWVIGLVVIGMLVWAVVQATPGRSDTGSGTATGSAEAILADRFARGEIDDDEYRRRRDALRS